MSKYTFIAEDRNDTTTKSFEAVAWPDILRQFQEFLLGCGFVLPPGELDFVDDSESSIPEFEPDYLADSEK